VFVAMLLAAMTAFAAPVLAAEAPDRVDEAARRALADRDIQTTLPGLAGRTRASPAPQPPPRGDQNARRRREPDMRSGDQTAGVGGVGKVVLWAVAIVAGLALIYFVLREVLAWRLGSGRKRFEAADAAVVAGAAAGPDEDERRAGLLDEADRLAARGAFAEAIHLILMHSLGRLEGVGEQRIGRSLTAREILRGSQVGKVTARARQLLGAIVGASELAHFGGRPADRDAYQRCREAFQGFAAETGEPA